MRLFIDNLCHAVGSKNAGQIEVADVVVSANHMVFLANKLPRLINLTTSAIFVSGTSGITAILEYRSVNPITLVEGDPKALFNSYHTEV